MSADKVPSEEGQMSSDLSLTLVADGGITWAKEGEMVKIRMVEVFAEPGLSLARLEIGGVRVASIWIIRDPELAKDFIDPSKWESSDVAAISLCSDLREKVIKAVKSLSLEDGAEVEL